MVVASAAHGRIELVTAALERQSAEMSSFSQYMTSLNDRRRHRGNDEWCHMSACDRGPDCSRRTRQNYSIDAVEHFDVSSRPYAYLIIFAHKYIKPVRSRQVTAVQKHDGERRWRHCSRCRFFPASQNFIFVNPGVISRMTSKTSEVFDLVYTSVILKGMSVFPVKDKTIFKTSSS